MVSGSKSKALLKKQAFHAKWPDPSLLLGTLQFDSIDPGPGPHGLVYVAFIFFGVHFGFTKLCAHKNITYIIHKTSFACLLQRAFDPMYIIHTSHVS